MLLRLPSMCGFAVAFTGVAFSIHGEGVSISFLNEDTAVKETLAIVRAAGCEEEAIASFKKAIERYDSIPLTLDLSRFPQEKGGFYKFNSMSQLVAALPLRLCEAEHAYQLNCFDTVLLLTAGQLHTQLRIDDPAGPFLVSWLATNGAAFQSPAATPRDAVSRAYPQWYLEVTAQAFPKPMVDDRMCLTAALFSDHLLPGATAKEKLGDTVFDTLRWSWRRNGVTFPKRCEAVLLHLVSFPGRSLHTDHAGVVIQRDGRFIYIEKAGGQGPFVRLDMDHKADLVEWFGEYVSVGSKAGATDYFATFNDTEIMTVQPGLPLPASKDQLSIPKPNRN